MGSINSVLREARRSHPATTQKQVREFLERQRTYTLHKPQSQRFRRAKTTGVCLHSHLQMDTVHLQSLKHWNSHYQYILTIIDVMSRQARAEALKRKRPLDVLPALKRALESFENSVWVISADKGTEFKGVVSSFLTSHGVKMIRTERNTSHANVVERFNRTLQDRLFRHMTATKSKRWVDALPGIVASYNASYHRGIDCTPNSITRANERETVKRLYGGEDRNVQYKYKENHAVRIKTAKTIMEKGYTQTFSRQPFYIAKQVRGRGVPAYRLRSENGAQVAGLYYEQELTPYGQEDGGPRVRRAKL